MATFTPPHLLRISLISALGYAQSVTIGPTCACADQQIVSRDPGRDVPDRQLLAKLLGNRRDPTLPACVWPFGIRSIPAGNRLTSSERLKVPLDKDNAAALSGASIAGAAFYLLRPDGHVGLAGTRFDESAVMQWFGNARVNLESRTAEQASLVT